MKTFTVLGVDVTEKPIARTTPRGYPYTETGVFVRGECIGTYPRHAIGGAWLRRQIVADWLARREAS